MSGDADLAPLEVTGRAARLRAAMITQQVDAVIVTDPSNVRWLTGFSGSNGTVLVDHEHLHLVTDSRYATQAPQEAEAVAVDLRVHVDTDTVRAVAAHAPSGRVAVEADVISWAEHGRYTDALAAELVALDHPIVALRAVKDAGELDRMRRAAAIADAALAEVRPQLGAGRTEREIALELEVAMRRRGATSSAYETIVAAGPNGALPHARPTDRPIGRGDLVVIDVGALYEGYRSDMTRSFVIGEADDEQQRQLDVVLEAQRIGVAAVAPGVATRDVDAACRTHIDQAGWGAEFGHGTGHGVGLDIHELPRVSSRADDVLAEGMLVTVEPGVYLPGRGGVRWEDLLFVGADGAEAITCSPKDPVVAVG